MISRQFRFHGLGSLRHVYQQGRTLRGTFMALKFMKNERRRNYRAAVVVSKKVSKSAVVRNRIRRRIYACLKEQITKTSPAYDLVITVYDERVATMPAPELAKTINTLLTQAGVLQ